MKPTKKQIDMVNRLIKEAIDHGGDAGGPYFVNGNNLFSVMLKYRDEIWGKDSGICVYVKKDYYPGFELSENESAGQNTAKERVEQEIKDLKDKKFKLSMFINSERYLRMTRAEQDLLFQQFIVMGAYAKILEQRLAIWREL